MGWGGMMGAVLGSKAFLVVGSASREGGGGEEGEGGGGGARSSRAAPFTGTALLLPLDWFLSVFWKACMSPLPVPGHQPQPRCPLYPLPGLLHALGPPTHLLQRSAAGERSRRRVGSRATAGAAAQPLRHYPRRSVKHGSGRGQQKPFPTNGGTLRPDKTSTYTLASSFLRRLGKGRVLWLPRGIGCRQGRFGLPPFSQTLRRWRLQRLPLEQRPASGWK